MTHQFIPARRWGGYAWTMIHGLAVPVGTAGTVGFRPLPLAAGCHMPGLHHPPHISLEEIQHRTAGRFPWRSRSRSRSKSHHKGHRIPYRPRGLAARRGPAAKGSTRGHSAKWERCVKKVKARGGKYNAYAVCTASVGW